MGNAVMENQRVRQAITGAMFALMDEKSFSEITVSDIVREAGVARASFYRNFDTKEAVIDGFIRDFNADILPPEPGFDEKNLSREALVQRMEYSFSRVLKKRSQVLALFNNGFGGHLQNIADLYVEELAGDMLYNSADKYMLYCFSGAGMNMLIHWLRDGGLESPHELAVACTDFFLRGRRDIHFRFHG